MIRTTSPTMPENCKDLSPDEMKNIFLGANDLDLGENPFQHPLNRTHLFNFSEEHFTKILEGFYTGRNDRNVSSSVEIALIIIYSFLIVGGLITNVLVSFVVARRKQMHTARNMYIVNLTISDMSLCLICMPFTLVMILRRHWTLGPILCKLVALLQGTNIMVSVGTITAIALDRYFTICKRSTQEVRNTRRKVLISIFLIWVISILFAMPLFFYQVVEPVIIDNCVIYEVCIEQWPSEKYRVSYAVAVLLIMAVIPPLVVGTVHARIAKYLNTHARTQKDSRRAQKELERNRKTTFILSGIVIIFAVSWLPLGCFSLLADLEAYSDVFSSGILQKSTQRIYIGLAIVHVIAMSSAISNPIVYGWMNSNIRHEFLQLLPFRCGPGNRDKNNGATIAMENDTTRTQLHYNYTEQNDVTGQKECTALLVTLKEQVNSVVDAKNSEAL